MSVNHAAMKLGRLPAKFDKRVPEFSRYLKSALPPAPPSTKWREAVSEWGLMGNDTLGNCTAASKIHDLQLWTSNASKEATLTAADAIKFYSQTTGYIEGDPSTDQGGIMLDVLNWWLKNDLAGHKIDAYATLDFNNRANIRDAVWLLGLADIGVNLPITAQTQEDWVLTPDGLKGDGEPASWGRHDCTIVDYDENWCYIATWGIIKRASWEWVHSYCEEAYAILSKEWLKSTGNTPSGFDYESLVQDMAVLGDTSPLGGLRELTDDPVLLEFKWNDLTIDINQAAATWVVGLLATALATHGYLNDSGIQTWIGVAAAAFATWSHLTTIHKMNWTTADFVQAISDVVDIIQRSKKPH